MVDHGQLLYTVGCSFTAGASTIVRHHHQESHHGAISICYAANVVRGSLREGKYETFEPACFSSGQTGCHPFMDVQRRNLN